MKKRILVLGYFGYATNQLDGQTVKTRNIYNLVKKEYRNAIYFDTQILGKNKLKGLSALMKAILKSHIILYVPAHNNLYYFLPILSLITKVTGKQIYYFVVGGWLVEFLKNKPIHRYCLKQIRQIFSETQQMKEQLNQLYHISNVSVFPNFRMSDYTPTSYHTPGKLKIVFMARINKMKGLDMIFELANFLEQEQKDTDITIDFYGPILEEDRIYFEQNIGKHYCTKYMRLIQPNEIYHTLEKYDILILPTHYYTEGLPGSIVDAYFAGIPVIVTEWKHAHEFVKDKETGFIIPFENGQKDLNDSVVYLLMNELILEKMKSAAVKESNRYRTSCAISILRDKIDR